MSTYNVFQQDTELEREGLDLDLVEAGKFRVARAGGANKKFQKRFEAYTKPFRRAIQTGTMSNEVADEILAKVYAECVVLGWEGVTGPDGQPLPFNKENCIKLFQDLPELFAEIRKVAEDSVFYRLKIREEDTKN